MASSHNARTTDGLPLLLCGSRKGFNTGGIGMDLGALSNASVADGSPATGSSLHVRKISNLI
jgi:hypothetical protein